MIFALKSAPSDGDFTWIPTENQDLFCLFPHSSAVEIPEADLIDAMAASLREGREVLVVESPQAQIPVLNFSSIWRAGDNWLWIAPRGYRMISNTSAKVCPTLTSIINTLKSFK
jgi:hypothetical protein